MDRVHDSENPGKNSPGMNSVRISGIRNGMRAADLGAEGWHKPWSGGNGGNCIEAMRLGDGRIALRQSTDPDGPALICTDSEFSAFVQGAKAGEADFLLSRHKPGNLSQPRHATERRMSEHGRIDTSKPHPARVYDWMPGSYLVLSQLTPDVSPEVMAKVAASYRRGGTGLYPRTHAEVTRFFAGLELLDPGVVLAPHWRPGPEPAPEQPEGRPLPVPVYVGVARKP